MSKQINIITSSAVPVNIENTDTDQIIPARFLKATSRDGFGKNLFRDWRYENDDENQPKKDFPLNNSRYSGNILVAAKNFGCSNGTFNNVFAGSVEFVFNMVVRRTDTGMDTGQNSRL
jgi:3-isopropylmalate/(R)-2-methylmalate dehydratase small subunit